MLNIKSADLETVAGYTSTLPRHEKMEIAFAGKSNVGKSSLINTLLNRKRLARVGQTPGKTQTINFYNVRCGIDAIAPKGSGQQNSSAPAASAARPADCEFYFVDLPGYGYAQVSDSEKAKWGKMIERYLHSSQALRLVFLLVDIRHECNANDRQMYDWIVRSGFRPVIIATKADKLKRSQIDRQLKIVRESLEAEKGAVLIPFSSETRAGREQVLSRIEEEYLSLLAELAGISGDETEDSMAERRTES